VKNLPSILAIVLMMGGAFIIAVTVFGAFSKARLLALTVGIGTFLLGVICQRITRHLS
jgi:hypothetical protein